MKQPKDKKCRVCKETFKPYSSLSVVCSIPCAVQYNQEKEWKKEKKKIELGLQTVSDLKGIAKTLFQKWIRLRDKDLPCISCGCGGNDWAGGHYFSAGKYSGMIFDEDNCHKQCNTHCNKYLSANLIEYRKGLVKRYGEEFVIKLENKASENKDYKYTQFELRNIIQHYKQKIKLWQQSNK